MISILFESLDGLLTQTANIHCKHFLWFLIWKDFFGRVKNKAGDMEKILKEKDKHGLLKIAHKIILNSIAHILF